MSYVMNIRERIHQPFRDTLIRTNGYHTADLGNSVDLFDGRNRTGGATNNKDRTLPGDQSMVILVLRVLLWFRNPVARSAQTLTTSVGRNGDYFIAAASEAAAVQIMNGSVPGDVRDVHRLYHQASEQLHWTFGTGEKASLKSMPTSYFPWGGGLCGDLGGTTDLIHWNNGTPNQNGILRMGRAIALPPRQNVACHADIYPLEYAQGSNAQQVFSTVQGGRDLMNLADNLRAADLVNKTIAFCFDGLWSREVQ